MIGLAPGSSCAAGTALVQPCRSTRRQV